MGIDSKPPTINNKGSMTEERFRESIKKENSKEVTKIIKNTGVQCDFMLENIMHVNEDSEKEELKGEIIYLKNEMKELKVFD